MCLINSEVVHRLEDIGEGDGFNPAVRPIGTTNFITNFKFFNCQPCALSRIEGMVGGGFKVSVFG
jgi:hypothetical protein